MKRFSALNAYALNEDGIRSPQVAHMRGDDQVAKQEASSLARAMV